MNRLALVLLTLATLASPTLAADQRSGPKLIAAYRKGYALLPHKQAAALRRITAASGSKVSDRLGDETARLIGGATSREALVAEKKAEIEANLTSIAQQEQDRAQQQLGAKVSRVLKTLSGRSASLPPAKADPQEVAREVAKFEKQLDGTERVIAEIDAMLKKLPSRAARAIDLSKPYGNELIKDRGALAQRINAVADEFAAITPSKSMTKFENVLMARMTKQVKDERPQFELHLKEAAPEALHAEALELIQEIRELSQAETMRSETTLRGHGDSKSAEVSATRAVGGLYSKVSAAASESHWSLEGKTLLPQGSDYSLTLRSASLPITGYGGDTYYEAPAGMLPLEARILIEKAVKVSELFEALGKRAPALAANIAPWVSQSRFLIRLPVARHDNPRYWKQDGPTQVPNRIEHGEPVVISMTRPKADLLKLANTDLIDAERAQMLRAELDQKMVSGLK